MVVINFIARSCLSGHFSIDIIVGAGIMTREVEDCFMDYREPTIETGISCFVCGIRSGIDCPGRKPGEATRCKVCLDAYMAQMHQLQQQHIQQFSATLG